MMHRVYLVPGFFGFANLGDVQYFGHARRQLQAVLGGLGVDARVHAVASSPTASLRQRAHLLLDAIVTTAGPDDVLHLVGDDETAEPWASQVRSVVMVATPNHGTPSAEFFASLYGKQVLRVLSLATVFVVRYGHLPVRVAVKLAGLVRSEGEASREPLITDELFGRLLGEFSSERRDAVQRFFTDVATDQGLLSQITPDGMDLFEAAAPDRPDVRYGCVVTRAHAPGVRETLDKVLRPYAQAMNAVYASCWALASRMQAHQLPALTREQGEELTRAYGDLPDPSSNDGMVPTLSQVRGTLIRAVTADHLDVIGHYPDPDGDPPHYDWIGTGSGFRRPHFEATWTDVAYFMLGLPPWSD